MTVFQGKERKHVHIFGFCVVAYVMVETQEIPTGSIWGSFKRRVSVVKVLTESFRKDGNLSESCMFYLLFITMLLF